MTRIQTTKLLLPPITSETVNKEMAPKNRTVC